MNRFHILTIALHWLTKGALSLSFSGTIVVTLSLSILAHGDTNEDLQNQARQDFAEYWDSGNTVESLHAAERLVGLVEREAGLDSIDLAGPLQLLATAQQELRRYRTAEYNINRSITISQGQLGSYDMFLTKPLTQLGKLYINTGKYSDAMQAFRRAQHIMHRNEGVYTLSQLDLVDRISSINVSFKQSLDADIQQRFYYTINQKHYGASDPEIIPAMEKMAAWFRNTGQYRKSLKVYREIVDLLLNHDPVGGRDLVKALRGIASVRYLQGNCCPEKSLQQVVDTIRADPSMDFFEEIDAIVELADMNLIKRKINRAKTLYELAWTMLTRNKEISHHAENLFSNPVQLGVGRKEDAIDAFTSAKAGNAWKFNQGYRPVNFNLDRSSDVSMTFGQAELIGKPLPLCYPQILDLFNTSNKKDLAEYYIDLDFTVNDVGRATQVAIKNTNAPAVLGRYVKYMLYNTRYRPKLVEGTTVNTEHVAFRQTFTLKHRSVSQPESLLAYTSTAVVHGCNLLAMQKS